MVYRIIVIHFMVLLTAISASCQSVKADQVWKVQGPNLEVEYRQNTKTVPLYEVFEISSSMKMSMLILSSTLLSMLSLLLHQKTNTSWWIPLWLFI